MFVLYNVHYKQTLYRGQGTQLYPYNDPELLAVAYQRRSEVRSFDILCPIPILWFIAYIISVSSPQMMNIHKHCVEETIFYLFGDKKTDVSEALLHQMLYLISIKINIPLSHRRKLLRECKYSGLSWIIMKVTWPRWVIAWVPIYSLTMLYYSPCLLLWTITILFTAAKIWWQVHCWSTVHHGWCGLLSVPGFLCPVGNETGQLSQPERVLWKGQPETIHTENMATPLEGQPCQIWYSQSHLKCHFGSKQHFLLFSIYVLVIKIKINWFWCAGMITVIISKSMLHLYICIRLAY